MSYYMEVSSCPTLPLSWVPNCPVPNCPVSKCPVPSCPVSSCPGFPQNMSQKIDVQKEGRKKELIRQVKNQNVSPYYGDTY